MNGRHQAAKFAQDWIGHETCTTWHLSEILRYQLPFVLGQVRDGPMTGQ